jgi:hypothetical protein
MAVRMVIQSCKTGPIQVPAVCAAVTCSSPPPTTTRCTALQQPPHPVTIWNT